MHRYNILITGLVMLLAGAYLAFTGTQALPLWFMWLAGTFLWNVGIAVSISGATVALLLRRSAG